MRLKFNGIFLMILAALILIIAACGNESSTDESVEADSDADMNQAEEENAGGTLNIALDGPPPTLDQSASTATAARDASRPIYEGLVVTDSDFKTKLMLAESIDTDDNKTYTFHLREGVKFHNGKEMIAEDVIASMERWVEISTVNGKIFDGATWTEEDDYTVVLELETPSRSEEHTSELQS